MGTMAAAKDAAAALAARLRPGGPRVVVVTSLRTEATPAEAIDLLAAEGGRCWLLRTPLLPMAVNGAGDALAALFLFHFLRSRDAGRRWRRRARRSGGASADPGCGGE